jgi:hypothetical protein
MYRFAGHDPQAFAFAEGLSAEQASGAGRSAIGYFHARCHDALRSQVANLSLDARSTLLCLGAAFQAVLPEPERDIHKRESQSREP